MQLCRLVYFSKYNINTRGNDLTSDLKQILASAIRNNSDRGITAGLVFNRKFFVQTLEGGHAAVTQTFARISNNPRHKDIVIAEMGSVSERLFGAWAMGYAGKTALFDKLCAEHGNAGEFDPKNMSGSDLTAFIVALVTHEANFASSQKISAA
jgi:hypothetical protein